MTGSLCVFLSGLHGPWSHTCVKLSASPQSPRTAFFKSLHVMQKGISINIVVGHQVSTSVLKPPCPRAPPPPPPSLRRPASPCVGLSLPLKICACVAGGHQHHHHCNHEQPQDLPPIGDVCHLSYCFQLAHPGLLLLLHPHLWL